MRQKAEPSFSRAFGRVIGSLGSRIWSGSELYHYTDLAGLKGIVESGAVWLSDHRFLNDPSEHSYGQELAIALLRDCSKHAHHAGFAILAKDVEGKILAAREPFYVGSFSLAADRLDQWKGYGRNAEAVCLEFKNDRALGRDGVLTRPPAIEPRKVVYDRDEQVRRLSAIVQIYQEEFSSAATAPLGTSGPWADEFAWLLADQFILYKHPEYASEEEVRLVLSAKSPLLSTLKVRHRVTCGRLMPYVTTRNELLPESTKLPIRRVVVGPLATQDVVIRSIGVFLDNLGYSAVPVERSSIPFRG